jgi:hypothetical protein
MFPKHAARNSRLIELAASILSRITGDDCGAEYSTDLNGYVLVRFDHSGKEVHT